MPEQIETAKNMRRLAVLKRHGCLFLVDNEADNLNRIKRVQWKRLLTAMECGYIEMIMNRQKWTRPMVPLPKI